jgi:hypothetical protein
MRRAIFLKKRILIFFKKKPFLINTPFPSIKTINKRKTKSLLTNQNQGPFADYATICLAFWRIHLATSNRKVTS